MKRAATLAICLILGLNSGAFAADRAPDPTVDTSYGAVEDAYAAMIQAGTGLAAQAEDAIKGEDPDLAAALAGFAVIAADASAAMDAHGGPVDLRCIYRGMAEDAARRAQELATAADADARQAVLEDIAFLADDAVLVTPEIEAENDALAGLPPMTCDASAAPVDAAAVLALFAD
jgi:hypothetical protein